LHLFRKIDKVLAGRKQEGKMTKVERTLYTYRDRRGTTDFTLHGSAEGIVVSYVSVFDQDTSETDTYVSRPFSLEATRRALDDLMNSSRCRLSEGEQVLTIVKEVPGSYTFSFDGGNNRGFEIQALPFDPVAVGDKLSQLDV
jgi:hypothetical protein